MNFNQLFDTAYEKLEANEVITALRPTPNLANSGRKLTWGGG